MITYLILASAKLIFISVFGSIRAMFPQLWSNISNGISSISSLSGFRFGLGVMDKLVGLDFLFYAIMLSFEIYVVVRLVRFIMGFFSKGG